MRLKSLFLVLAAILITGAVLVAPGVTDPGRAVRPVSAATSVILYGAAADNPVGKSDGQAISFLYRIDPATGAATLIGSIGYRGVSALDFEPATGVLYGVGRRVSDDAAV